MPESNAIKGQSNRGGRRAGAGRKSLDAQIATAIRNQFGAFPSADPYQPQRTYIYCPLLEPNRELDAGSRLEIARRARALYNRSGPAVRAVDFTARGAVGVGLLPRPRTADPKWNRSVKERFAAGPAIDRRFFDAARQVNYFEALDLLARQTFIDGDVFWQKLRATDGTSRVRIVEGTCVGNSNRRVTGFSEDQWTDGARLDSLGAVTQWRVLRSPGSEQFTDVPETDLLQVKRPRRAGAVRGVSWLAIAALHLHDLHDKSSHYFDPVS